MKLALIVVALVRIIACGIDPLKQRHRDEHRSGYIVVQGVSQGIHECLMIVAIVRSQLRCDPRGAVWISSSKAYLCNGHFLRNIVRESRQT